MAELKRMLSLETLEIVSFFESLSIGKTLIEGEQTFEIAPLKMSRNEGQLLMRGNLKRLLTFNQRFANT